MMLLTERQILESRIKHERRALEIIPPHLVIEKRSIEREVEELEEILAGLPECTQKPVSAQITFGGPYVITRRGISAGFGTEAVQRYLDGVKALGRNLPGKQPKRGEKDIYDMLITRTAAGSFGFVLEAPEDVASTPSEHPFLEMALEKMNEILLASVESDDTTAQAISDVSDSAVKKVYDFVKFLAEKRSTCNIEFREKHYPITDIPRSESRLNTENISEENIDLTGTYRGVLPGRQTFELLTTDEAGNRKEVFGKISPDIDPDEVDEWNGRFHKKPVRIRVRKTVVRNGKPSYLMLEPPVIVEDEHS